MVSIFTAVATNDCQATSFLLRDCGNHVDEVDDLGRTCLHIASSLGYFQIVQILLSFGADPNIQDWESGWTALHRAVYFNHLKIALLLISAGAILENKDDATPITGVIRDKDGMTPMDLITYKLWSGLITSSPLSSPTIDMPKHVECEIPIPKFNHFGALYAFGKADVTLGIALPKTIDIVKPRRVETMTNISSHNICTGKYHCLATSENGEVYSWGHNRGGKLGHHSEEGLFPVPTLINFFVTSQHKIVRIALSDHHSMALSNSGVLFTWGSNRFGQLGHSDIDTTKQISCPRRLEFFKRDIVVGMASGDAHCICFTENGDVYTWGSNKHGQLGLKMGEVGTTPSGPGNTIPKKISLPTQLHSRHTLVTRHESIAYVVDVVAAYQSSLILIKQRSASSNSQGSFFFHKYQQRFSNGFTTEIYQWGDGVPQPRKVHFSHNMRSHGASTSIKAGNNTVGKCDDKYLHNFSDYYWSDHSQIIQLCAGKHHFAALSLNNIVFTWGLHADSLGHAGSIAHSMTSLQQSSPQIVYALLPENLSPCNSSSKGGCFGSKIISLAAAGDRTAAVTEAGDVYTWGVSAQKGVLSPDTAQTCQFVPKKMSGVKCVKTIALAEDYTMIIVDISMPVENVGVVSSQYNPQGRNNTVKNSSDKHLLNRILSIGENNDSEEDSDSEENETTSHSGKSDKESITESAVVDNLTNNLASPRSLQEICQLVACNGITFKNVFSALQFAETYYAELLQEHCLYFIYRNLIALLTYMKPSEIDRVVSDWKLPQSFSSQKNGSVCGNGPYSTAFTPSLSQRKSMGDTIQNKALNTIASNPNSPVTPKVEYSNSINYSDPKVIASAMKAKEIELQAISTVSELQKCMRSVKKRIAAIQELQDKVSQEKYLLSVEQNEKVQRKALLQAEYALMEQFLVRLSVREKQSHNIGHVLSEDKSIKNSSSHMTEVACSREQTVQHEMLCNREEIQKLTSQRNSEPVVSQKSNKGKTKWKKFDPLAEVTASSIVTLSSATGSGRTVLSPPVAAATDPGVQSITKRSWNIAPMQSLGVANQNIAEKTVKVDTPESNTGNCSAGNGTVTAVNLHPATLKKPSTSGNNTPVLTTASNNDFGLAFDFEKALEAKRKQKKTNSNKNIPENSVDNSKLPQNNGNVPKPAWGGASMKPKEESTPGGVTSPSTPTVITKPAQSLADILAEEEAMRIQKRFHPSYVPPSPALAGINSGHPPRSHNLSSHSTKPATNPWYIANKTLALPLHQVIEQQSEEQEFEQQLKRIQEMENLEKMQRSSGKPKNSGKQKQKNIK